MKYSSTADYDINYRIKNNIPLTRKQVKAQQQRKISLSDLEHKPSEGYKQKNSVPCVLRYKNGHAYIAPVEFFNQ